MDVKCLRKPPAARAKCLRALPAHRPTRDVESTLGEEGLAARWVLTRPAVEWFNDRGPYGGGSNTAATWVPKVDADDRPFGDRRRAEALLTQVQQGFGGDLLKALTQYPLVATDTGHLLDGWHRLYLWVKSGLPGGPPTLVMVPGRGGLGAAPGNGKLVFRGITQDEHDFIVTHGYIQSNERYCVPGEGTCFGADFSTAESYVNYGHTNPVSTGHPTYVIAVIAGSDIAVDRRDGYPKVAGHVASDRIKVAYRFNPDGTMERGVWSPAGFSSRSKPKPHPWRKSPAQWGARPGLGRVSDLCTGKDLGRQTWDYSCVLPAELKGYTIRVEVGPSGNYVLASVWYPGHGRAGQASGVRSGTDFIIGESFLSTKHRGRGLGVTLYEALFSHAFNHMGVRRIVGALHSTSAHRVHEKLAAKHGLKYSAAPNVEKTAAASGEYDEKWGPYGYPLAGADDPRTAIFKQCSCGREFTQAEWESLPVLGHTLTDDADGWYDLELRNCPSCHSTLGVEKKTHDGQGQALSGPGIAAPESLEAAVERFQRESGTRCTVQGSFKQCAVVARHLTGRLQHWGFPAKDIELFDLLVPLGSGAHPTWKNEERKGRRDFVHHATLVGDRIIDLAGAQFGAGVAPRYYSLTEASARWREIVVPEPFTGKVLEKLKGLGGMLTPDREAAFARFQDAVRHVWNKPEFVLPVIALSSEEPGNNRNPGGPPVLASITFIPQGVWAVGNRLLRRAPTYMVRLSNRLFALSPEDQWKILVHEAVHLGYPRHSREFRDLCREKGGTVSEEALDGQGIKAEKKVGARYQVVRTFTDEKEATRWAKEQQRAEPGSRWRLSLGGVSGVTPLPPEFWRWFRGSKVVNADGSPLVVYHGTVAGRDFSSFKPMKRGREVGFHFGPAAAANDRLTQTKSSSKKKLIDAMAKGARILPVFLAIKNPVQLTEDPGNFTVYRLLVTPQKLDRPDPVTGATMALGPGPLVRAGAITPAEAGQIESLLNAPGDWYESRARDALVSALQVKGYDGIVYPNAYEAKGSDAYVAFEPTQVKSAIGNRGTFDPGDPRITA